MLAAGERRDRRIDDGFIRVVLRRTTPSSFHLEAQDRAFRRLVQPVLLWGHREKTQLRSLLPMILLLHLQSLWEWWGRFWVVRLVVPVLWRVGVMQQGLRQVILNL